MEFGRPNPLKERLRRGEVAVGTMFMAVTCPAVGHLVRNAGFDFLIVDMEHSWFTFSEVFAMIQSCRSLGISAIVRIPEKRYEMVARTLDIGADGILVPHVDTPEEAEHIVQWAKYPPRGERGIAIRTGQSGYRSLPADEWVRWQNEYTMVIAQIESTKGVENAPAIASVEGVDVIFVGPGDLSLSLGLPGQPQHPKVVEAVERIISSAKEAEKPSGIHVFDLDSVRRWTEAGMTFICYGSDVSFLASAREQVERIREMTRR